MSKFYGEKEKVAAFIEDLKRVFRDHDIEFIFHEHEYPDDPDDHMEIQSISYNDSGLRNIYIDDLEALAKAINGGE